MQLSVRSAALARLLHVCSNAFIGEVFFSLLPFALGEVLTILDPHAWPSMRQFGNVYLIAGISIIGGGLFGFDISSMSAM